jgi:hypothetical protein
VTFTGYNSVKIVISCISVYNELYQPPPASLLPRYIAWERGFEKQVSGDTDEKVKLSHLQELLTEAKESVGVSQSAKLLSLKKYLLTTNSDKQYIDTVNTAILNLRELTSLTESVSKFVASLPVSK